jgi:hypothetical protein
MLCACPESFVPIRPYGIVDPLLNRASVKAMVVVVTAAVLASIAHAGYQSSGRSARSRRQKYAAA